MTPHRYTLQAKVLFGMSVAFSIIVLPLIYMNLFLNQYFLLASLECGFLGASVYMVLRAYQDNVHLWQVHSYLIALLALIVFALTSAPLLKGVFFWVFCIPIIFYIMLGKRFGFAYSLFSIFGAFMIFFQKTDSEEHFYLLHESGSINFISTYATIWVVSHFYESNREKKEAELYRLANTDMLTGAKNRHAFKAVCDELLREEQSFSITLIDIDHFKEVNDQYGHDCGDAVLVKTVECIQKAAGHHDVYRLGGEEFCILCPAHHAHESCTEFAGKIREMVAATAIKHKQHSMNITVSIGLAHFHPGDSLESVFKQADNNMYLAKTQGRNQVVGNLDISHSAPLP